MKFIVNSWKTYWVETVEECDLLFSVSHNLSGRGFFKMDGIGDSWVFDAEEHFSMFCMIKHGFSPIQITDNQYKELIDNNIVFLSKTQTIEAKKRMIGMIAPSQR